MSYLDKLKSKSSNNLQKLIQASKKTDNNRNDDDRIWKIERDKSGNAFAVIRFLPVPEVDMDKDAALPWVVKYSYAFKNDMTGAWYIEDSPVTIGGKDPVAEQNRLYWNSGLDSDKELARKQGRKTNYYSNILVIKDPQNPDNEGKVFLYRYGKKIYDKIMQAINPDAAFGDEPQDPFDLEVGLDFRLKIRTVDKYPNYDNSDFAGPKPVSHSDGTPYTGEEIDAMMSKAYSLLEIISPEKFKSYEQLKERFDSVTGGLTQSNKSFLDTDEPLKSIAETKMKVKEKEPEVAKPATTSSKDDDDLDFDSLLEGLDD